MDMKDLNDKNIGSADLSSLPLLAMDEIPEARADAKKIKALVKEGGKVTGYQLEDGQILSKEEGVSLAKQGGISGVGIANRSGSEYLKSIPHETENNNLNNLPSISQ